MLEILIRLASGLFQHGRVDECDLWKLTEVNSDSRFLHRVEWKDTRMKTKTRHRYFPKNVYI
ncbi:hypothetical protein Taro_048840 [Colocasia esculenta]|uniref:Uncharacterized protein n=1 Tax=Colocasia esculenta TaxID=4460 RepID=A0A843X988_COLES|nr:hypothetical protein [Colocasia esculenta]